MSMQRSEILPQQDTCELIILDRLVVSQLCKAYLWVSGVGADIHGHDTVRLELVLCPHFDRPIGIISFIWQVSR